MGPIVFWKTSKQFQMLVPILLVRSVVKLWVWLIQVSFRINFFGPIFNVCLADSKVEYKNCTDNGRIRMHMEQWNGQADKVCVCKDSIVECMARTNITVSICPDVCLEIDRPNHVDLVAECSKCKGIWFEIIQQNTKP